MSLSTPPSSPLPIHPVGMMFTDEHLTVLPPGVSHGHAVGVLAKMCMEMGCFTAGQRPIRGSELRSSSPPLCPGPSCISALGRSVYLGLST